MDSESVKQEIKELHKDFLLLCEKYRESFEPLIFSAMMATFSSQLAFKVSPCFKSTVDLLAESISIGEKHL
jgi:hypothetical protein